MKNRRDFLKRGLLAVSAVTLLPGKTYSIPAKVSGCVKEQTISIANWGGVDKAVILYNGSVEVDAKFIEQLQFENHSFYDKDKSLSCFGVSQFLEYISFNDVVAVDWAVRASNLRQAGSYIGLARISPTGNFSPWQWVPLGDFAGHYRGDYNINYFISGINYMFNKQSVIIIFIYAGCSIDLTFYYTSKSK